MIHCMRVFWILLFRITTSVVTSLNIFCSIEYTAWPSNEILYLTIYWQQWLLTIDYCHLLLCCLWSLHWCTGDPGWLRQAMRCMSRRLLSLLFSHRCDPRCAVDNQSWRISQLKILMSLLNQREYTWILKWRYSYCPVPYFWPYKLWEYSRTETLHRPPCQKTKWGFGGIHWPWRTGRVSFMAPGTAESFTGMRQNSQVWNDHLGWLGAMALWLLWLL